MTDASDDHIVRGSCHHDCPDTCVWEVTVDRGTAVQLRGSHDHPTTRGQLCPKVNRFLDRVYHHDRVLTPLRRVGRKGNGEFEPISWDDALEEIADRWSTIIDADGSEAILQFSFAGTQGVVQMGLQIDRLFDLIGASDIRRHLCGVTSFQGAADAGVEFSIDPEDLRHAQVILLWGTNTLLTNRHLWPYIDEARSNGAVVVAIDPVRTMTAARVDVHVQLRPGTDELLIAAMIQVLVRDGLADDDFLAEHTTGWPELRASALKVDLDGAARVTDVSVEQIEWLARTFATRRPAAIRTLVGPEHRRNGRTIQRAVSMLPAVTGAWRDVGGGLARSTQAWFDTALDLGTQPRPLRRRFNMAHLGSVLMGEHAGNAVDPPIRSLFVHNSNPAVVCPDQGRIIAGLERDDLFTVVHEQFVTDTARYADLVLPATTQIEQLDLGIAWGHMYLSLNQPAIAPVGEAATNTDLARRLANALGIVDEQLSRPDEQVIRDLLASDHPLLDGITYEGLVKQGWARLNVPPGTRPPLDAPRGRVGHDESSAPTIRLTAIVPNPPTTPPQPVAGDRGAAATGTTAASPMPRQFLLMSRKHHPAFLNANYEQFPAHHPRAGGPAVHVHPDDVASISGPAGPVLVDGDPVAVANERGALTLPLVIADDVQPGVVAVPFGWGNTTLPEGRSVNVLTSPETDPDDQGSAYFSDTWVTVRPAQG